MQHPRRTSEFNEEVIETAKKRLQVRGQTRSSRPASLDRVSCNPTSIGVGPSRASIRGTTPQRSTTPLHSSRVLLTAEKQRSTAVNGAAPLHNDKKWVKERCAYITEHLREEFSAGALCGVVNVDFFSRPSGGLRQMSIKQFVGIINHFLHYIWGNRFSVSCTGHVDDIVNVLQKLDYPYQMNKSWLKTPNAQHSFGNIIVLLDFLMDFVPSTIDEEEKANGGLFPLSAVADGHLLEGIDSEFQALMLRHSAEGFLLWDKQQMKDFTALQQRTCDALILKRCGIQGAASLNAELEILRTTRSDLEKNRPKMSKKQEKLEKQFQQLSKEYKNAKLDLRILHDNLEQNEQKFIQLQAKRESILREVSLLEEEIAQTKSCIRNQVCSREQREKLIEEIVQQKHVLQCKERTVLDLQERNHQQQVLLSRSKKQLTNQVEKFNVHMREIVFTHIHSNLDLSVEDLQLPLNLQQEHLERVLPLLHTIQQKAAQKLREDGMREAQLQREAVSLACEIDIVLEPKSESIHKAVNTTQSTILQFEQSFKIECDEQAKKLQQLDALTSTQRMEKQQHDEVIAETIRKVQQLQLENEEEMCSAGQKYNTCASARERALDQYTDALDHANNILQQVMCVVNRTGDQLNALKKELSHSSE